MRSSQHTYQCLLISTRLGRCRLSFEAGAGAAFSMVFYAVPVSPGRSRLLAGYSTTAAPALVKQALGSGASAGGRSW